MQCFRWWTHHEIDACNITVEILVCNVVDGGCNEIVVCSVTDDGRMMRLLCTMLHMVDTRLLGAMLQIEDTQWNCCMQCCRW